MQWLARAHRVTDSTVQTTTMRCIEMKHPRTNNLRHESKVRRILDWSLEAACAISIDPKRERMLYCDVPGTYYVFVYRVYWFSSRFIVQRACRSCTSDM